MSSNESIAWWKILALCWGFLLMLTLVLSIAGTPKGQTEAVVAIGFLALGFTVLYLLILSWRAAYLAGRGKR